VIADMHTLASDVLAACVASLDTIPVEDAALDGAPERSYVAPGVPVWDCCEQLVVWVPGARPQSTRPQGPPGAVGKKHVYGMIPIVEVQTVISRCVPTGDVVGTQYQPPTVTALETAAAQIHADGWALYNGIFNRVAQGLLSERCSEVVFDGLTAATPAGGCGGWTFTLRMRLDGYGYGDPIGT